MQKICEFKIRQLSVSRWYFFYLRQLRNCPMTQSLGKEKSRVQNNLLCGFFCTSDFLWSVLSYSVFKDSSVKQIHLCQHWISWFYVSLYSYLHFIRRKIENPRLRFFSFSLFQELRLWSPAVLSHLLSPAILLTWGEAPVPGEDGFSSLIADLARQSPAALLMTL